MRIGELAEQLGMTTKTVRFYEQRGLLPEPPRTTAGYRDYGPEALERLAFVRDAQLAGLSLAEIASVVELKDAGAGTCAHTTALLDRHLTEIEERLAALALVRARLQHLAARAHALDPAACTDPHRCQVIAATNETASPPRARSGHPAH